RRGGGHFDNVAVHVMSDRFGSAEHRYVASYIVGDEDLDLALLRITSDADGRAVAKAFPFLRVGDFQARGLRLDDQITAWGFPLIGGNTLSSYSGSVHGFWGEIDLDKFNEDWIHSESARTGLTPDQVTIRLMGEIPG